MALRTPLGALVALALAAGCGDGSARRADAPAAPDDGRWWEDESEKNNTNGLYACTDDIQANLSTEVRRILTAHCAPCHSGQRGVVEGGLGEIFDVESMHTIGVLTPKDPEESAIYMRAREGQMPPPGAVDPLDPSRPIGPVSTDDLGLLRAWVMCGAPPLRGARTPLSGAELRALMLDDLAALPAAERANYRYVSLTGFHGSSRFSSNEVDAAANAVSYLFALLSPFTYPEALPVTLLDPAGEVAALRLDLRHYDVDAADWARLEAATEVIDRQAFPCEVPFLQAEQLLGLATSDEHQRLDGRFESLYSNIVLRRFLEQKGVLGPGQLVFDPIGPSTYADNGFSNVSALTFVDLARALGVDLAADIAAGGDAALRLCTPSSSVTVGARCAQRDVVPAAAGAPGGLWWTMDLAPNSAVDVFTTPVGPSNGDLAPAPPGGERFALTSGVALWPWPSLAPGFTAFDEQLRLRSAAATYSGGVAGAEATLGSVVPACAYCHTAGPIPMTDTMLSVVTSGSSEIDDDEAEFVRRLHRPAGEGDIVLAGDGTLYGASSYGACVRGCSQLDNPLPATALMPLAAFYLYDLTPEDAARALFLDEAALRALIEGDPELAAAYPLAAGVISRNGLVATFGALRRAAVAAGGDEAALNFCVLPATAPASGP